MNKPFLLLFFATITFMACGVDGDANPNTNDSIKQNSTDTFHYNPATPAAQNSDEPERFYQ